MKTFSKAVLFFLCTTAQAFIPESSFTPIIYQGSNQSVGGSFSTSAGGSVGANASQSKNDSESYSKTHANSQIRVVNLNSDSQSFTLAGANVEITHDINLNTQHLTVESVQDTHQSSKD